MPYPSEVHAADDLRFDNLIGLTYDPQRAAILWPVIIGTAFTDLEVWSLTTRSLIRSGAIDTTAHPSAGRTRFGFTRDSYVYSTMGAPGNEYLCRWADYGNGSLEDLGHLGFFRGCQSFEAGDGKTYICTTSYSTLSDGYLYNHTDGGSPTLLDTSVSTGHDFQVKAFALDGAGDIWAIGGLGSLASNLCAFWRIVNASGISRTDYFTVTMPAANAGNPITTVSASYAKVGATDQFLVYWAGAGVVAVNYAGTITAQQNSFDGTASDVVLDRALLLHDVTASSLWIGDAEYAVSDLSLIRTTPYSAWAQTVQQYSVFDPTNNALLAGLENTNENFAWLFLPTLPTTGQSGVSVSIRIGASRALIPAPPVNTELPTANVILPSITGEPDVGDTIQGDVGTWTGNLMTFQVQWTRDGADIGGATSTSYTVQTADKGHTLAFRVVPLKAGVPAGDPATSPGVVVPDIILGGTPSPSATVGTAYSFTPTVSGGTGPYAYSLPSGTLPSGILLNTTPWSGTPTAAWSGTPTTAQTAVGLVLQVTDSLGSTAQLSATIAVAAAGSTSNVTPSTWYAALQAATPGTVLTMAPGDYGTMGVYGVDHAAPGVTLQGQAGVTCSGGMEIAVAGVTVTGITFTGLLNGQYGVSVHADRVTVDRCTFTGNNPGGLHTGVGIYARNATNLTISNNVLQNLGDGIDGGDCTGMTVSGNHITKYSDNAIFWANIHNAVIERNYIANIDNLDPGTHPDTVQIGTGGSSGRSSNITIRYNNYDAMNGAAAQGIGFCESVDGLTITGNCTFGAQYNGVAASDSTNVTITDNFVQGWTYSPQILVRGASNIVTMTGNWCASTPSTIENCTNVTINSNTVIANATGSGDTTLRNTWLASHPLVPTS